MPSLNNEILLELLEGIQKSDRKSQKRLYECFFSFSMGVCMRYAKDREEAEELVNDSFMKVFKNQKEFLPDKVEPLKAFRSFLKRVLINTSIDRYRANIKFAMNQSLDEKHDNIAHTEANAFDGLVYEELIGLVQKLSPAYRTVFNLYVIDGFSHDEVAKKLGISEGTSKSNLSKARVKLQEMVKNVNREIYERYA